MTGQRHPLREPMLWLTIALPAAAVVAGVALVVTAVRSGGDDMVIDPVRRTAQIQVSELGPDERARALKLTALVRVDDGALEVLPIDGGFARNEPVTLVLSHPSQAAQDRRVELAPSELGWRAATPLDLSHDWLLQLAPQDHGWRLRGRLKAQQRAARVGPALPGG